MKKIIAYVVAVFLVIVSSGCASSGAAVNQELIVDKQVQPLTRNEVIYAVKECETNGLRAVVLYAKRKINGYTTEIVAEVTCAPKMY